MKRLGMFLLLAVPLSLATLASCMGVLQSTPVNTLSAAIITLTITGTPTIPTETVTSLSTPTPSPRQTPIPSGTPTPTAAPVVTPTPEATATRAPTATAEKAIFVTSKGNVNFRTGPGTGYGIVTKLGAGASVYVDSNTKKDNGEIWYHGVDAKGNEGWISSTVGEANEAALAVPTAERTPVPPTPKPVPTSEPASIENVVSSKVGHLITNLPGTTDQGVSSYIVYGVIGKFEIIDEDATRYHIKLFDMNGREGPARFWIDKSLNGINYKLGGQGGVEKAPVLVARTGLREKGSVIVDGVEISRIYFGYWAQEQGAEWIPESHRLNWFNSAKVKTVDYSSGSMTVEVMWDDVIREVQVNANGAVVSLLNGLIDRTIVPLTEIRPGDWVKVYLGRDRGVMESWSQGLANGAAAAGLEATY